jgi:thioredoxin reductase
MTTLDVLIIGGGVAGLSCAVELARLGFDRVEILEREAEAGGIPRHCGHWGFGLREFGRIMRGPDYSKRLAEGTLGHWLRTRTSVLPAGGTIEARDASGVRRLTAGAVVLAMGARESPRSARLISGTRPLGVMNTGTLQQLVYLHGQRPFQSPVIAGSELVSFSALLTLRHAGIRARAMIEENRRITARRPGDFIARLAFGVPVMLGTKLRRIIGTRCVEAVEIERGQETERLQCDGVILTGRFRPESALLAGSHLVADPRTLGPAIDQHYRCSDPTYFAAGNVLRGIETAGQCWREGRALARTLANQFDGKLAPPNRIPVDCEGAIAYVYPQFLDRHGGTDDPLLFKARVRRAASGWLRVLVDDREVWSRRVSALPERRVHWQVPRSELSNAGRVMVRLAEP